ncbi:PP2C family protein-serine/threonine phosphatase [Planosporangium sp. 12N6]|uniref:PP2C family protein-serine/threonine phosphatase n=1 Tax=Planosporangium spinosum TaxID=3402278 RepID=UPI003CEBD0D6
MEDIRAGARGAVAIDPGTGAAGQGLGWGAWYLGTDRVEWSERLYRLTGRRRADGALALPVFLDLAAPDDRGRLTAAVDRLLDNGTPVDVEYLMRAADRARPVRATFELQPGQRTLYAVVNDLTELNRVRDRLLVSHRTVVAQQRALAQQRELNDQLQQVILPVPTTVTDVNGTRVAVRYLAADDGTDVGTDVGGDWYLALPLADGDVVFAVGDVVGHGLAAAPPMIALRHAAAAYAVAGHEPGEVLAALNTLLCRQGGYATATAVVARYRPRTGELRWARAGHPPIMVAGPDRVDTRYEPAGILLGVYPEAVYEHASVRLGPDDVVLMYTDGLIEQRGHGIDEGVRDLAREVAEGVRAPRADRLTSILDRLHRRNPTDDACMLAVQPMRVG